MATIPERVALTNQVLDDMVDNARTLLDHGTDPDEAAIALAVVFTETPPQKVATGLGFALVRLAQANRGGGA
jgi:hypothetical protein